MNVSIVIATYGDSRWREMVSERAFPSTYGQGAYEVLFEHYPKITSPGPARNELASQASGDYLIHLDADDELAPGYLDAMERANRGTTFYEGKHVLYMPAVTYIIKGKRRPPLMRPIGDLTQDNFLVIGTMVPRELFLSVGGFSDLPHGFEDWSLFAKCWKAGAEIVQVPRANYIAHVDPNSKHRQGWRDRKWQVEMHNRVRAELFPELT